MNFRKLKPTEYKTYSNLLCEFENQFSYPLGKHSFKLTHNLHNGLYFDFFDNLGTSHFFVLEHNNTILGVGCAILRTVYNNGCYQQFWYLCDFKLNQTVRGKGKLTTLLFKYFIPLYLKSNNFLAINMAELTNNWLANQLNSIFFFLKLTTHPVYFYQWEPLAFKRIVATLPNLFSQFELYTNHGNKDIVMNNQITPIVHLVDKNHAANNLIKHQSVCIHTSPLLTKNSQTLVMFSTTDHNMIKRLELNKIKANYTGTMITTKRLNIDALKFSSLEI